MKNEIKENIKTVNITRLAQDIINMKISNKDTLSEIKSRYFKILKRHGICKGVKESSGAIAFNSPEWTICTELFYSNLLGHLKISDIMGRERIPKEIRSRDRYIDNGA